MHRTAQSDRGELAVIVRSDVKGHGFGRQLMQMIIAYARSKDFDSSRGRSCVEYSDAEYARNSALSSAVIQHRTFAT